jgi:hypothetical protein
LTGDLSSPKSIIIDDYSQITRRVLLGGSLRHRGLPIIQPNPPITETTALNPYSDRPMKTENWGNLVLIPRPIRNFHSKMVRWQHTLLLIMFFILLSTIRIVIFVAYG